MKNLKIASSILILVVSCLSFAPTVSADDREIGGYVDRAEDRFVRNVWNFIKNFQGFQNIGSHRYQEVQYFWGEPFEFDSSHQAFVDKMDLSYVAAHGNSYYVQTNQALSQGVDLRSCPPYGDLATGGDLEFLIIESCSTIWTAPDVGAGGDWWTPWTSIFRGLHQAVGFHTLSYSDNGIPNNYANKLKANGGVWQSWFQAVNEERSYAGQFYPGHAAAIMYTSTEGDRLGNYAADPAGGSANMLTWWQY